MYILPQNSFAYLYISTYSLPHHHSNNRNVGNMIDLEIPKPERSLTAYLPCGNKTQTEKK